MRGSRGYANIHRAAKKNEDTHSVADSHEVLAVDHARTIAGVDGRRNASNASNDGRDNHGGSRDGTLGLVFGLLGWARHRDVFFLRVLQK